MGIYDGGGVILMFSGKTLKHFPALACSTCYNAETAVLAKTEVHTDLADLAGVRIREHDFSVFESAGSEDLFLFVSSKHGFFPFV